MSSRLPRVGGWPKSRVHNHFDPDRYMLTNFPLRHAALSADGDDVAVAGSRGLALYSRRSARWRLFGDVSQVSKPCRSVYKLLYAGVSSLEWSHSWRCLWTSRCLLALLRPRASADAEPLLCTHPQEREVSVQHLVWLPRVVVACVAVHPGGRAVAKSGAQVRPAARRRICKDRVERRAYMWRDVQRG